MDAAHELDLGLPRLTTETVQTRVYRELRKALVQSRFAPGQKLTLRQLAEAFGVSTMPVRSAVERLVAEGGLEMLPQRCFAVPDMTQERLVDLRRVRRVAEGTAVAWAAPVATDAELQRLRALSRQVDEASEGRTPEPMADFHVHFHEFRFALYAIAASPVLLAVIEDLWLQVAPYFTVLRSRWEEVVEHSRRHRLALLDALAARDAGCARSIVETDIDGVIEHVLAELRLRDASTGPRAQAAARLPARRATAKVRGRAG